MTHICASLCHFLFLTLDGPDPFQCPYSGCDGFLLWEWTLKVEIQHNRNVLYNVIAWSLQQRTSKIKFSCMCHVFVIPCDCLCNWKQLSILEFDVQKPTKFGYRLIWYKTAFSELNNSMHLIAQLDFCHCGIIRCYPHLASAILI